jgi:hypothetical protein
MAATQPDGTKPGLSFNFMGIGNILSKWMDPAATNFAIAVSCAEFSRYWRTVGYLRLISLPLVQPIFSPIPSNPMLRQLVRSSRR